MKNLKIKKKTNDKPFEGPELKRVKRRSVEVDLSKVNFKSPKFWKGVYEEDDDLPINYRDEEE